MVPGDPPRVVYPFADEALWLAKDNSNNSNNSNGNARKDGPSSSQPPVPVSAETEAAAQAARAAAAALGATATTNVMPNATTMGANGAAADATNDPLPPAKQFNSTTVVETQASKGPLDKCVPF